MRGQRPRSEWTMRWWGVVRGRASLHPGDFLTGFEITGGPLMESNEPPLAPQNSLLTVHPLKYLVYEVAADAVRVGLPTP